MAATRSRSSDASGPLPSSAIEFLLDGELYAVRDLRPTTTVLQFLREHLGRTGTKEGCAEGDCGACTVVIAELDRGRIRYRAINACIKFLATLHGKALLTVESLARGNGGNLHAAQQAMIECHGSQCGFCTPGFVMSLFALRATQAAPTDEQVRFALAGNLCRCTGYRPILAATRRMYEIDADVAPEYEQALMEGLQALAGRQELDLAVDGERFTAPTTTAGLARCLAERPQAVILAGGTDVGLRVTKQHAELRDVVYIGNVEELQVASRDRRGIDIGAGVPLADAFAVLLEEYPDLHEIARRFASLPICNAGTLCGNVANGSPIGDSMPALIALGATVTLRHDQATREIPLEALYLGYRTTALRPGEFIERVHVPASRPEQAFRSYKVGKRYEQDISAVCGAFSLELEDGRVTAARVCFGGMAAIPQRAAACERVLNGAPWNAATIEAAAGALEEDYQPITDLRASAAYRRTVAGNLLRRFHGDVAGTAEGATVWRAAVPA